MRYPKQIKSRSKIEALTGIKSSLDKIRSVIAFVYLLFVANERKSFVKYSVSMGSKISIEPNLLKSIENLIGRNGLETIINNNPLITNQYEPLYVGVTLLMKMGYLKMEGRQNTAERTGGVRFPKQLYFANNILVLDLILKGIPEEERYSSLYEWLQNRKATSHDFEERICMFLSTCTIFTQFKLRDDDNNELFFQTEGIYAALREGNNDVIFNDNHEFVGPTRIYNNVLKEGLEPWIEINKSVLSFSKKNNPDAESMGAIISTTLDIHNVNNDATVTDDVIDDEMNNNDEASSESKQSLYRPFITAIKSKPFLLLAGISGTGKSRIVRELAFKSCPEYLQDKDGTTPGNYCMIEVKPNWHDSTELLGYYSNMNKSYQFKKFVKFLVKAKMFPKVPFFVCLDEMNLAPVEHYFAEMLSIMETRKHPKKENSDEVNMDVIRTGVIVESQYFKEAFWKDQNGINHQKIDMSDKDWYEYFFDVTAMSDGEKELIKNYQYSRTLQTEGLTLPDNVIIIGTVNMDDTTHQFSRKVIDRAMTIEMNGGKLSNMFGGSKDLEYLPKDEQEKWQNRFRQLYVNADEVLKAHPNEAEVIIEKVPAKLENINKALKGTPFEVSYRVLNELTIMVGVLLDSKKESENIDDIINQALDHILLMKILPRIEGDSDMFNLSKDFKDEYQKKYDVKLEYNNRLEWLMDLAPEIVTEEQEGDDHRQTAREKIKEMTDRLKNQEFTRFWP